MWRNWREMQQPKANFMPHPERASEPILANDDGRWIFESGFAGLEKKSSAEAA